MFRLSAKSMTSTIAIALVIVAYLSSALQVSAAERYPHAPMCLSIDMNKSDQGKHIVYFSTNYIIKPYEKAYFETCFAQQTWRDVSWSPDGVPTWGPEKQQDATCVAYPNEQTLKNECLDSFIDFANMTDTAARDQIVAACTSEAKHKFAKIKTGNEFHYIKNTRGQSLPNPLPPGTNIKDLVYSDYTSASLTRRFQLVIYPDASKLPTATPVATITPVPLVITGKPAKTDGGLQHGTQGFVTPTATQAPVVLPPPTAGGPCNEINYDPYGYVFDAQTLEPVMQAKVIAYELGAQGYELVNQPEALPRGYVTGEDGSYAFIVRDGKYKVDVIPFNEKPPAKMERPLENSGLETVFSNIRGYNPDTNAVEVEIGGKKVAMYTDIYPLSNINYPEIVVKGRGEHRDLPVKTGVYASKLALISKSINYSAIQGFDVYGRSSHPLSRVSVYLKNNVTEKERLAVEVMADSQGKFYANVPTSKASIDDQVSNIVLARYDDTSGRSAVTSEYKSVAKFPLKGFAYDTDGQVLANTDVSMYLTYSILPLVTVKTDSKGYFEMPRDQAPQEPVVLHYGAGQPSESNVITVSEFLKQNKNVPQNKKTNNTSLGDFESGVPGLNSNRTQTIDNPANGATKDPADAPTVAPANVAIYIVILFMLIIGIAIFAVYYIKKKQEPHNYEMEI